MHNYNIFHRGINNRFSDIDFGTFVYEFDQSHDSWKKRTNLAEAGQNRVCQKGTIVQGLFGHF